MICAWNEFMKVLPPWMKETVDLQGRDKLQELRLRIGLPPELLLLDGIKRLQKTVTDADLRFVINGASQYSPWAAATIANGYITIPGGHRIGICGEAVIQNGIMTGIRTPSSLCMRVARDFVGISKNAGCHTGSILIIGRPGSGKSTLLRDLIRQRSEHGIGSIAVVDERGELFPTVQGTSCFFSGKQTDIMTNCTKIQGITTVLRTMGPRCIAVDEITEKEDCDALLNAGWCGVSILATAHAGNKRDLMNRPVYRPILEAGLFDTLLVLQDDKSWRTERI